MYSSVRHIDGVNEGKKLANFRKVDQIETFNKLLEKIEKMNKLCDAIS